MPLVYIYDWNIKHSKQYQPFSINLDKIRRHRIIHNQRDMDHELKHSKLLKQNVDIDVSLRQISALNDG